MVREVWRLSRSDSSAASDVYERQRTQVQSKDIKAVGIGYQMHGLGLVDADRQTVRPSIIWCDGRAVATGDKAFNGIVAKTCLTHCPNSPCNLLPLYTSPSPPAS